MSVSEQASSPPPSRRRRAILRAALWMGVGAFATVALLAGAAWLALPALEQRPELAARWLEQQLGRAVRLQAIELAWETGAPLVRLRGLEVGETGTSERALALDSAEVRFDALGSIRAGGLRPRAVTVRRAELRVERGADGEIVLGGLGHSGDARARDWTSLVLAALPPRLQLSLEDTRVTLAGVLGEGAPVTLAPVNLRLADVGEWMRFSGTLSDPSGAGALARVTLRWRRGEPDPLTAADVTLTTRSLPVASLPQGLAVPGVDGRVTLDLDGKVIAGRLEQLRGSASVDAPRLSAYPQALAGLESVHGLVDIAPLPRGWRLDVLRLEARTATRTWPAANGSVTSTRRGDAWHHLVRVDHAPIPLLLPALEAIPPAATPRAEWLAAVQPRGRIEALEIALRGSLHRPRVESVGLRVRDALLESPDARYRLGPLDARVTTIAHAGRMEFAPTQVELRTGAGMEPLRFAAGGELRWHREADALVLDSAGVHVVDGESRVHLEGALRLPADPGAAPAVSVAARSALLQVAALKPYLRLDVLPAELRDWLESAVAGGQILDLEARLEGTLAAPAEVAAALSIAARVEGGVLRYVPGWPELTALRGELSLARGRLEFRVEDGSVSGADIVSAEGEVADVAADDPTLTVHGRARGGTENAKAFLFGTPMAPRFGGLLAQLDARGRAALDLHLDIPLSPLPTRVAGRLRLEDNTLAVPALRSPMRAVTGNIEFDRGGLGRGELRARYLNRDISAVLDGTLGDRGTTRLAIRGATDPGGLIRLLYDVGVLDSDRRDALPLLSRLEGEATGEVVMYLPHERVREAEGIDLTVTSDLAGMALALPAPLGKPAATKRELRISTRLVASGARTFHLRYGERTRAALRLSAADGHYRLERGELRFGGAEARLPDTPGLDVRGEVRMLSVDEWVSFLAAAASIDETRGPQVMGAVREVAVTADRLDVVAASFDRVDVRIRREGPRTWLLSAAGADVRGEVRIPDPVNSAPIDATFEHLHVKRAAALASARDRGADAVAPALQPKDLPPARLVARRLRYNDIDLGLAKLTLRRDRRGLLVEELLALNDDFEVRGTGRWTAERGETRSEVDLRIHTGDFGRMTAALGYGDSGVDGGAADISLRATWQGSPFDLALERVNGELHFRASGGRLREVERGTTGRVFGLLNLTVLPRRLLRLDFSDLFQEGVDYSTMEGSFELRTGNAYTGNVRMETDNARVELAGRVGLVSEDFDQIMTVTPKLSTSLPLAPLWLAEKLLNRTLIDRAFSYRYIITGPWDDPKIERERVEAVPSEAG